MTSRENEECLTMSVEDAAKVLGISRQLAYEMVHQGKIPVLRFGRRLVIPRAGLLHLLGELESGSSCNS